MASAGKSKKTAIDAAKARTVAATRHWNARFVEIAI
jgi:hypothetical protein